jgi:hypothetical protein
MATTTIVYPQDQEWVGIAREAVPGTAVAPGFTVPVDKPEPDNKPTMLEDKSLIGSMATDGTVVEGTQIADYSLSGNVFLDAIGYFLHNVMGDYTATGSSATNSTTLSAQVTAGATTASVALGTGYATGQTVQLGIGADGNPELVVLTNVSGTTLTFANTPARFTHLSGKTVATVSAPFIHVFSLYNGVGGQPPTHTITHYTGIGGSYGARQYASWCGSAVDFTIDAEKLFTHSTKGTAYLGAQSLTSITNSPTTTPPQPDWEFLVGIGGPASGGTLVNNVTAGGVTLSRTLKSWFGLNGAQSPYIIARAGFSLSGKFTQLAQDETPLTNLITNAQPQLQLKMSNGLSGSSLLAIQFDIQVGAYLTDKFADSDHITYDTTFKGVRNTTNAGQSGGLSPGKVTLTNAVSTY